MSLTKVIARQGFRDQAFKAKIVDYGLRIQKKETEDNIVAFLSFDDGLPDIEMYTAYKDKPFFNPLPDGTYQIKTYGKGIGQVLLFLGKCKVDSSMDFDPGNLQWLTTPDIRGATASFDAKKKMRTGEDGTITESDYPDFIMDGLILSGAPVTVASNVPINNKIAPSQESTPEQEKVWSAFLKNVVFKEKKQASIVNINDEVIANEKILGTIYDPKQLINRKANLRQLMDKSIIDIDEKTGNYFLVA